MQSPKAVRVLAVAALLVAMPLHAQWDPGASQQLGMGHGFSALSQSTLRNAYGKQADDDAEARDYAGSGKTRAVHLDALRATYAQRLRSDGKASADAWAFEMGRRDAARQAGDAD